ncbi:hypothetical protein DFQ28_009215 [Apophysomyces sp. BC1034]|nr:hypothetical protein DFQ30_008729 [Apophysomyces sp. BC1015]KAG0173828.1 hypothetical protein DFQ29_007738 [Apophysomyces sp. BC1021]KAG0185513.1 hypothetical protein DFQ28_009215 [Apophysomyces sp. BC1034]
MDTFTPEEKANRHNSLPVFSPNRTSSTDGRMNGQRLSKEGDDDALKRGRGKFRSSMSPRANDYADDTRSARSSVDFSDGTASSKRSSRNFVWSGARSSRQSYSRNSVERDGCPDEDSDVTTDVSIPSTPASNVARFSRFDPYQQEKRNSTMEKLHMALENWPAYDAPSSPKEDWEDLLRQYDRYDDDDKRKSRRSSRMIDSFNDPPGKINNIILRLISRPSRGALGG